MINLISPVCKKETVLADSFDFQGFNFLFCIFIETQSNDKCCFPTVMFKSKGQGM